MILAGDIGGTKVRFGLFQRQQYALQATHVERFSSHDGSFEEILSAYLKKHAAKPEVACFGVPGPVVDGKAKLTNLKWELDEDKIAKNLDLPRIKFVNDLAATAAAIPSMSDRDLEVLHPGAGKPRTTEVIRVILAPGTGLGKAYVHSVHGKHYPLSSEGGHVSFAPENEEQLELLRFLWTKFPRVSAERLVCGPGLVNIFEFLAHSKRFLVSSELEEQLKQGDKAGTISQHALAGTSDICVHALDMFVAILGSLAGDAALSYLANGGIYLGGGIPPKILPKLKEGGLVKSYLNKGRLTPAVERVPLLVIKDDHTALFGAAHIASWLTVA